MSVAALSPAGGEPSRARQRVIVFALLVTAIAYIDRICISMAAPAMRAELGISDAQMGYVFSAFTLAYALFEVPSGWLADRFGARIMLARIVVWWSLMTAATGLAAGFASLLVIRLLFGMGEAGVFPSVTRAFGRWLPLSERGRAFGLTFMAGGLGGAVTQPLVVAMLQWMHWRHTFMVFGVIGLIWAVAWYWWFRDDPQEHQSVNAAELRVIGSGPPQPHGKVPWAALWRSPNLMALCGTHMFAIYGWYFYLTWLPTYLLRARGFDLAQVGWLAGLPLLTIAGGLLFGGWASDRLSRRFGMRTGRRIPGLVGQPLAAVAICAAALVESSTASALYLGAAAGLGAFGVSPSWAACLDISGRHAGVVGGVMNTFGNLGGALSPMVVGWTLEHWGGWTPSLMSIAVCYVLAAACWLRIDAEEPIEGTAG
ncbi:MAG: MFS transporter [Candidatus Binatia bacterium]